MQVKIARVRLRREVSDEQHSIGATFLDKRNKLHESSKESTKREEDFVSLTEELKEKSKSRLVNGTGRQRCVRRPQGHCGKKGDGGGSVQGAC